MSPRHGRAATPPQPAPPTQPDAADLPAARGPLSDTVTEILRSRAPAGAPPLVRVAVADPYGDDLQLALYLCYELHYRGFHGVDPDWEWDPGLLRLRAELEERFVAALRRDVPGGDQVIPELDALLSEPTDSAGVSDHLLRDGQWWQLREYLAHRSVYHLKEADPHAWVIPRLTGRAKAGLVSVEYDEFGAGHADRAHSQLFADLLAGAGLDPGYLRYLDVVPAPALALVNLMSLLGLHRSQRGALVGHFAAAEITTAPSAYRLAQALKRLGAPRACVRFYTEHVTADAVHEHVLRHDVVGGLLEHEPELAPDVVFGVQATGLLEDRLEQLLLTAWQHGETSLRHALTD